MTVRLVFLDIDGVLTSAAAGDDLDSGCIARLNELLARADAQVVITSSWRERLSYEEIGDRLREHGFAGTVRGATPIMPGAHRGEEVRAYLATVTEPVVMVILDDVDDYDDELRARLVMTDEFVGLSDPDVERASELLGNGERRAGSVRVRVFVKATGAAPKGRAERASARGPSLRPPHAWRRAAS